MSRLIDADVFIEYLGLNAENSRGENDEAYLQGKVSGWNACIDAIGGGDD